MIIVDTSVLVGFLRGVDSPAVRYLAALDAEILPYRVPELVAQELLQGARDEREWEALVGWLDTQLGVAPADARLAHRAAARIYFDARRRGVTVRSTVDCFLAAIAIEHDAVLLHDDADFERMTAVCSLRTWRPETS